MLYSRIETKQKKQLIMERKQYEAKQPARTAALEKEFIVSLKEDLWILKGESFQRHDPEERWEDALVTDINYNTITVLDPYGAFGETAKLDFSDLLDVEVTSGVWYDLKKLETNDYQHRNGDYPRSGRPDTINVSSSYISFSFKNTPQSTAERWVERYLNSEGFSVAKDAIHSYQSGDYHDDWVDVDIQIYKISNNKASLTESTLTAEEKVDAWHNGTRRENYKAAGVPKLNTFLDIARRKGYTEIVDIIEAELAKRGAAVSTATPTTATASTSSTTSAPVASAASASEDEVYAEPTVVDIEPTEATDNIDDVAHFSDELVKEPEAPALSDKDRDAIIGKTIDALGKPAFYVRSFWKTAMGFIGSYSTTWYNSNYNEVKATRAQDKIRDLTYSSDKLIVLRSHYDGGSKNIDRYYSIEVPSSTKYIVDTDKIRDMIYGSYYDSELDWRISTLAKTPANRKKFKQYLLDTVGMPVDQVEELTTYAFDKRVW